MNHLGEADGESDRYPKKAMVNVEETQCFIRQKIHKCNSESLSTMFKSLTNWLTGIFLILLGLYHNMAGGSLIGQWLRSLSPQISPNDVNMGQLGFEMGGYLAMAIGLTFILLGNSLARGYYLFWAIVFLVFGGISLYTFKSFHESQLVWFLTILLGACYFLSPVTASSPQLSNISLQK